MIDTILNIDEQILLWFNGYHTDMLDWLMKTISGKLTWIPFYAIMLWVLFRKFHWKVVLVILVSIALAITLADQIGASVIRPAVERMRPSNPDNPFSAFIHIVNGYRSGRYGFPSCHAANTFALATVYSMWMKRRSWWCGLTIWAIIVSCSRLYLGVHYPTDILVGAILGVACGAAAYYIVRLIISLKPFRHALPIQH
ncbi:MAG: phosphatase PAP2 family protein [Muribaculaceae bacterium]|nr:phosphatase PAP2 family protein [Muribaculaceae bacterium]